MNIRREIYISAAPPPPEDRDRFLRSLPYPKLTYAGFVLLQVRFIRKRIWAVSLALLLGGVFTVCAVPDCEGFLMWEMSAVMPFLATVTAEEISRSDIFGMREIEASCRFSLPQLTGARMLIVGVCDFIVISAVTVLLGLFSPLGILNSALYMLSPFTAVCGISLMIFERVRGQEGVYISTAAALAVGLWGVIFIGEGHRWNRDISELLSLVICAAGILVTVLQTRKLLSGKENYYGTQT